MKRQCQYCYKQIDLEQMLGKSKVECPNCGHYIMAEIEAQALLHAEKIGVYEYELNDDGIMEYWSFFPGEGFRFIQHDLNTGEERRDGFIPWQKEDGLPVPAFLKGRYGAGTLYNYNVG